MASTATGNCGARAAALHSPDTEQVPLTASTGQGHGRGTLWLQYWHCACAAACTAAHWPPGGARCSARPGPARPGTCMASRVGRVRAGEAPLCGLRGGRGRARCTSGRRRTRARRVAQVGVGDGGRRWRPDPRAASAPGYRAGGARRVPATPGPCPLLSTALRAHAGVSRCFGGAAVRGPTQPRGAPGSLRRVRGARRHRAGSTPSGGGDGRGGLPRSCKSKDQISAYRRGCS